MENLRPVKILLVEDDLGDQKLTKRSLACQKISNELYIVETGEEALEFLSQGKAGDWKHPLPDLILLDLNMPGMGGKEFLRKIKADEQFSAIPVVILTTSDFDMDIIESYKLHAAGYVKKPVDLSGFQRIMSGMEEYWFVICKRIPEGQLVCKEN